MNVEETIVASKESKGILNAVRSVYGKKMDSNPAKELLNLLIGKWVTTLTEYTSYYMCKSLLDQ